ncbi:hypothetical protein ACTFIW_011118 [Dictyostelium discoideum]
MNNEDYIYDNELEKKNLKSIKEIAQSYSISTNRLKKAEIIEKIKVVKRKREYEEEEKQKENVNPSNKNKKLTNTDNNEPTEKLFWELFRNIVIFKKIFSFIDNQFSITYDSMSSITQLIDSNRFCILKDKVYRNCKYLQFNTSENSIDLKKEIIYLVKLFSIIDDDYRFYRNFFNMENDYYNSSDAVAYSLIDAKKLEMFKLFINEFNYQPTKTDLLHSIINGSNKFIKYLLELNPPNSFLLLDKECTEVFKDFNRLNDHRLIQRDGFHKGLLCYLNYIWNDNYDRNQYLQLLIGCITGSVDNYDSHKGNYEINEKSTLKTLITTVRLILKLKTPPPPLKDVEEKEFSNKIIKPIETVEEIDNFINKIDNANLKSLLDDPINFNSDNEVKNFIKKLLKLYYSTFGHEESKVLYFCYYHEEFNNDYTIIYPSTNNGCNLIGIALRFGIYEILKLQYIKEYFERVKSKNNDINGLNLAGDYNLKVLFSHCYDRERKFKFIDEIVEKTIIEPIIGFQSYFLYLLVTHNNLELVKYYSNKLGNHIQIQYPKKLLPPTYFIESIEMLEFLFYNQCNYFIDIKYNNYISTFYKNLELLKHFESLWGKSKQSLNQLGSGNCSGSGSGSSIHAFDGLVSFVSDEYFGFYYDHYLQYLKNKNFSDFVNHFVSNAQLYCNNKFRFELLSINLDLSYKHSYNFQTKNNLVINGHVYVGEPNKTVPYSKEFLKFMDWAYTNYNDELKNGGIFAFKKERYHYHLLIAIDRYDSNNDNGNNSIVNKYYNGNEKGNNVYIQRLELLLNDVNQLTPYLYEINNFKFLNWFLTIIQKYHNSSLSVPRGSNCNIKNLVMLFMKHIISNSKLQILEYIDQNFDFILKKNSDGGILNIKDLKKNLFSSLQKGKVKISKFLFQYVTITKIEFQKNSNEKSKKYIKTIKNN